MISFPNLVAYRTLDLLNERRAILYAGKCFYIWPRDDRAIIIFDTSRIDIGKINADFAHRLSTRLQGRHVVRTNTRGLFLQIGYDIPAAAVELTALPLDLSEQETPYHMPIGSTDKGGLWISLIEGDSFLIGGVRRMGKSALLHGFIQALLHGGKTLIYAWDGKENAEYMRYVGRGNFNLLPMTGLQKGLEEIRDECVTRMKKLAASGKPNIIAYNALGMDFISPIALVIDEVAEVEDQDLLAKLVKLWGAAGVYPIFATNDPSKSGVIAKGNLGTRISFAVPSHTDSLVILGRTGANKLPKVQGRGIMERNGRMIEFQSFTVDYPQPTDAGLKWMADQLKAQIETDQSAPVAAGPVEVDPGRVRELFAAGKTITAIVREITGGVTGGSKYLRIKSQVEAALSTTTTTNQATSNPILPEIVAQTW
jgi:DNA segregation ATPase FtsK/SpoIIIE-like protein